eukprot:2575434-Pyramimonas_sp.AAC.1
MGKQPLGVCAAPWPLFGSSRKQVRNVFWVFWEPQGALRMAFAGTPEASWEPRTMEHLRRSVSSLLLGLLLEIHLETSTLKRPGNTYGIPSTLLVFSLINGAPP